MPKPHNALAKVGRWLAAALAVACAGMLLLFLVPSLAVNTTTFGFAASVAEKCGLRVRWDSMAVTARSPGFWRKSLAVDATNLCVHADSGAIDGCFDRFQLAFAADLVPSRPRVTVVGPVTLQSRAMRVGLPGKDRPVSSAAGPATQAQVPAWLAFAQVNPVTIDMQGLDVQTPTVELNGAFALHIAPAGGSPISPDVAVVLSGTGLCLEHSPVPEQGCVTRMSAKAVLGSGADGLRLKALGPVLLEADAVRLALPAASLPVPPTAAPGSAPSVDDGSVAYLPSALAAVGLPSVHIKIRRGDVRRGSLSVKGEVTFDLVPNGSSAIATVRLGQPCLTAPGFRSCFAEASSTVQVSIFGAGVHLVAIGPIAARGGQGRMDLPTTPATQAVASPASAGPPFPAATALLPVWLREARLFGIAVAVDRLELHDGERWLRAKATLHSLPTRTGGAMELRVTGRGALAPSLQVRSVTARLLARSAKAQVAGPWDIAVTGRANGRDGSAGSFNSHVSATAYALRYSINVAYHHRTGATKRKSGTFFLDSGVVLVTATGTVSRQALGTNLNVRARRFVPGLAQLDVKQCRFDVAWPAASVVDRIAVSCRVAATPSTLGILASVPVRLPALAEVALEGDFAVPWPLVPAAPLSGHAHLKLMPLPLSDLTATADATADLSGTLSSGFESLRLPVTFSATLGIPKFERVVAELASSRYAVPAPFDVLAGGVTAGATWHGDPLRDAVRARLVAQTRLAGEGQVVDVDVTGVAGLAASASDSRPFTTLDVLLKDVRLALPTMHLLDGKLPQILPDARLAEEPIPAPPAVVPPSRVAYLVHVHSPSGQPLQVVSNLARGPVAVQVDIAARDERPISGQLDVGPTPLNLFKRSAQLDRVLVRLAGPESTVDAGAHVTLPDYVIQVLATGPLANPVVKLLSTPPRPQRDLAVMLLSSAEHSILKRGEAQALDRVRAAEDAGGAFGMSFLFLLAAAGGLAPGVAH